jgi:hypothetical protein
LTILGVAGQDALGTLPTCWSSRVWKLIVDIFVTWAVWYHGKYTVTVCDVAKSLGLPLLYIPQAFDRLL